MQYAKSLSARESQYAAHTYRVGPRGRIVYEKGNDPLIDADRCALLAHWRDTQDNSGPVHLPLQIAWF